MRSKVYRLPSAGIDSEPGLFLLRLRWKRAVATGIVLLAGALSCGLSQQGAPGQAEQNSTTPQSSEAAKASVPAGTSQQEQPMAKESAELLKLATELKADVDKSSSNTLSMDVIRKAEQVEHAARHMKDMYKASAGVN